jgi:YggT family protein
MFILGNFVYAIALILRILISFEMFCIILSAVLSWFPVYGRFTFFCHQMADFMNRPIRRVLPPLGPVDISPLISILILVFLDAFLVRTLFDLAEVLR